MTKPKPRRWRKMDSAPLDGTAVVVKLRSGDMVIAWHWPEGWLCDMTALTFDNFLAGRPIPEWTEENRKAWVLWDGPHPASQEAPGEDTVVAMAVSDGSTDDYDVPF